MGQFLVNDLGDCGTQLQFTHQEVVALKTLYRNIYPFSYPRTPLKIDSIPPPPPTKNSLNSFPPPQYAIIVLYTIIAQ